ncbi:MAG: ABC transporter [Halobacteriovorax sp.]|nr:ABC transporter [Halobacteriovorax sp.]|tara:strand:+ start:104626 stop:106926 length:2301 start_codon:yes stop_codon:yes gene_type:complete
METLNRKQQFIKTHLRQEGGLPKEVKKLLERMEEDPRIQLYGLSDLDERLKFQEAWVILTKKNLFIVKRHGEEERLKIEVRVPIERISDIKENSSLSCSTFICLTSNDLPPVATWRFTQRQKIIMGHLKYLIEEKIKDQEYQVDPGVNADEEYVNSVLKPVLEAQNSVSTDKKQALWRLLAYLLPYKRELAIGTAGAVLTTAVSLVPAYVSGYLIDQVVKPFQDGVLSVNEASTMAWILVGALTATYVLREFFVWLRLNKMSILGEKVARDLRDELYAHLQTLSMDFYSKKQTGSIISRVSSDTDRIWDFVAFGVVEVGIALITLSGLSAVLISMDWKLGLIMTIPVPLLLFAIYRHGEGMKRLFLKAWRKWSDLTNVLSDTIPGVQVVKAFNQEEREKKRFNDRNGIIMEEFNNIHQAWTGFWPVLMMGIHAIVIGVWAFATPRLIADPTDAAYLSAGTFVSFLLYLTMFSQPIEVIGQVARMLNRALSSAYRIFEILDTNPTIQNIENPIVIEEVKGHVQFNNVSFSYDGVRKILKGINFDVKPGEMIGLVGTSGGGKSTITKLIARFYDIDGGDITIDGHNIKDLDLGLYRRQVGMVLQDPYLFHGTILDNIGYGVPNVSRKEIIEAAKIANAHNFIGKLPHGYDTVVGERGHTLSGGERQRVSIARAILANPRVLILDEATSAVDTETERNIQEALDRLIEGRTVFAVAHRLSTLRKANRIFVIDNGEIVERGTHEELLSKEEGEYRKLHKMQQEMSEYFAL